MIDAIAIAFFFMLAGAWSRDVQARKRWHAAHVADMNAEAYRINGVTPPQPKPTRAIAHPLPVLMAIPVIILLIVSAAILGIAACLLP